MNRFLNPTLTLTLAVAVLTMVAGQNPASGAVIGNVSTSDTTAITADLTAEGTLDWKMWGEDSATDVDEKIGADAISALTNLAGTTRVQASSEINAKWSDGTPDLTGDTNSNIRNNATGDESDDSTGRGFSFTVPSGPGEQVLKVYTTVFKADGTLTASLLNEGSSYSDTVSSNIVGEDTEAIWEITFSSVAADTLTVEWKVTDELGDGSFSNINLVGATLVPEPATLALLGLGGAVMLAGRRRKG